MPFQQVKLEKSVDQTRGIFDKFLYRSDDSFADITQPGYFSASRFRGSEGWAGGIIEVQSSDGYSLLQILENDEVQVNYTNTSMAAGFLAFSSDSIAVSLDQANPSFLTGLTFDGSDEFELFDAATGAVKNVSNRTIRVQGTISYNPDKIGGGVALLQIFSESSTDEGASYSLNQGSLRPVEVANAGESFKTTVSFLQSWAPGQIVRFRVFEDSNTAINIIPSSTTALNETITGYSVVWVLGEV